MATGWKIVSVVALLLAVAALGLGIMQMAGIDLEEAIARGGNGQGQGHAYGNLKKVIAKYDDPMRGMSGMITYRDVFQNALWYQINNPLVDEVTRIECFTIAGMLHENNTAELTEAQHDTLMEAVELMWGPVVLDALEEDMEE